MVSTARIGDGNSIPLWASGQLASLGPATVKKTRFKRVANLGQVGKETDKILGDRGCMSQLVDETDKKMYTRNDH